MSFFEWYFSMKILIATDHHMSKVMSKTTKVMCSTMSELQKNFFKKAPVLESLLQ